MHTSQKEWPQSSERGMYIVESVNNEFKFIISTLLLLYACYWYFHEEFLKTAETLCVFHTFDLSKLLNIALAKQFAANGAGAWIREVQEFACIAVRMHLN